MKTQKFPEILWVSRISLKKFLGYTQFTHGIPIQSPPRLAPGRPGELMAQLSLEGHGCGGWPAGLPTWGGFTVENGTKNGGFRGDSWSKLGLEVGCLLGLCMFMLHGWVRKLMKHYNWGGSHIVALLRESHPKYALHTWPLRKYVEQSNAGSMSTNNGCVEHSRFAMLGPCSQKWVMHLDKTSQL